MNTKQEFADYQSFDSIETARYILLNTLEEYEIPYELAGTKTESDFIKGTVSWVHPVVVKIPVADFERTNALLEASADQNVYVPERHYLLSFSDNELTEILQKPDEWSKDDYAIAKKLLAERGHNFTPEKIKKLREERLAALARPETAHPVWIYAGFAIALAGGVFAIFLGRVFYASKKTLPNGKKYYTYDKDTRQQGFFIFVTGIVAAVLWAAFILLKAITGDSLFST
jgi:hypothetical protein